MNVNYARARAKLKALIDSDDLLIREMKLGEVLCGLIYLDGLSDKELLERDIIRPLTNLKNFSPTKDYLQRSVDYGEDIETISAEEDAAQVIAEGDIVFVADGAEEFFVISLKKYQHRAVQEPPTEIVLKGPREGFIEDIKVNLSMLRRKLKTPKLRVKFFKVGRYSNTAVSVVYVDGVADMDNVEEVCRKISHIDIDGIIGAAYIERYIEQNSFSLFNQAGVTEKPDIVMARILEGRVAIFIDGSPVVTTVPYVILKVFRIATTIISAIVVPQCFVLCAFAVRFFRCYYPACMLLFRSTTIICCRLSF
jgi:Bacillus/Clostridium GerA spore germination protein.